MPNDLSSVEPYDDGTSLRNSFFSVGAEISQKLSYDEEVYPHFLTAPHNMNPTNLIHIPDWATAYCK